MKLSLRRLLPAVLTLALIAASVVNGVGRAERSGLAAMSAEHCAVAHHIQHGPPGHHGGSGSDCPFCSLCPASHPLALTASAPLFGAMRRMERLNAATSTAFFPGVAVAPANRARASPLAG